MRRAVLTLGLWLTVSTAAAQAPCVVVYPREGPVQHRLVAELEALGLRVEVEDTTGTIDTELVRRDVQERDAVAAVAIRDAVSADLWVRDPASHALRATPVRLSAPIEDDETLIAVRTVEILRAHLVEVQARLPTENRDPTEASTREVAHPPPFAARELLLSAGATLGGSPDGFAPVGLVHLAAFLRVHRWIGVGLSVELPFHPTTLTGPEGSSEQWVGWLYGQLVVPMLDPTNRVQPWVAAGLGAGYLRANGQAEAGWTGGSADAVVADVHLAVGADWAATEWLWLGAHARAGAVIPAVDVAFAGAPRGRLGPLWTSVTLQIGVSP